MVAYGDEGTEAGSSGESMEPEADGKPDSRKTEAKRPTRRKAKAESPPKKPGKRTAKPDPAPAPGDLVDGDVPDHGPMPKRTVELSSVDHTDKSCQLRVHETSKTRLRRSLRGRGQINPIRVYPGDNGYIIIDGHSRVAELRKMGRTTVDVIVYAAMPTAEARRLAFEFNVMRRNLSASDKGSIFLEAKKQGLSPETIAENFDLPLRTVQRYAAVPDALLKHFNGDTLTYTHCEALAEVLTELPEGQLEGLVARIKKERLSGRQLRSVLREKGLLKKGRGRPSGIGLVRKDEVILRSVKVCRTAPIEDIRSLRDLGQRLATWAEQVLNGLSERGSSSPPQSDDKS